MTETVAYGYSSESTQRGLSNKYQHYRVYMVIKKSLRPCALDESSLSFGRVKIRASGNGSKPQTATDPQRPRKKDDNFIFHRHHTAARNALGVEN